MRIILILLLIVFLFIIVRINFKENYFNTIDLKTDSFDTIDNLNLEDTTINLNKDSNTTYNYPGSINIGNDLIVKKKFFINVLSNKNLLFLCFKNFISFFFFFSFRNCHKNIVYTWT